MTGFFVIVVALVVGYFYFRWANGVPDFDPPAVRLPSPNGFDAVVAAADLVRPAPGVTHESLKKGEFDPDAPVAEQRAMVAANRDALAAARTALALEFREPPQYVLTEARYPHYAKFRNLARGFATASRLALDDGHPDEAARWALDVMDMGSRIPCGAPLIGGLVGLAVHSIGVAALEPTLPRLSPAMTKEALARVQAPAAHRSEFAEVMESERLLMLGGLTSHFRNAHTLSPLAAARYYQSQTPGEESRQPSLEAFRLAFSPKRALLAELDRYYRKLIAESRKPWRQRREPRAPRDALAQQVAPKFSQSAVRFEEKRAVLAALETWLAARRFQQEHGRLAHSIAELSLGTGWTPPVDPFSGRRCVYRPAEGGFIVYSIGSDEVDDGGKPLAFRNRQPGAKGDIVIGQMYPPSSGS